MIDKAAKRDLRFDDYPICNKFLEDLQQQMIELLK